MLRLLRQKKHCEIAIRFRDHEPFFNGNFFRSFALALLLHSFAFFFFEIRSLHFKPLFEYQAILIETPSSLFGDLPSTKVSLQVDSQGFLPRDIMDLASSQPKLAKMPFHGPLSVFANQRPNLTLPSFAQIENFSEGFQSERFDFLHFSKSVKLRLYGEAASRKAWVKPSQDLSLRIQKHVFKKDLKVSLDIRLDDRNGRIFWAVLKNSSGNERVDALALELMEVLRFERNQQAGQDFVTQASLELFFPAKS